MSVSCPSPLRLLRIVLLAAALPGTAWAAKSPACALLTMNEAQQALGGTPRIDDGGAADRSGYSDCAWLRAGGDAVLSVLHWEDEARTQKRYDDMVGALKRRRQLSTAVPNLGDAAMIFDESGGGLMAFTIVTRQGPHVLQIIARGVTRSKAVDAARAMAGRLPAALRPSSDLPAEVVDAAPMEPVDVAPVTEEPEAPDEARAAETAPDQPEAQPEAQPETPPAEPEPAPPETAAPEAPPAPPPAEPRKTVATVTGSPACALLKPRDLTQAGAGSGFTVVDGGPERVGESNCTWQSPAGNVSVTVNLLRGRAIRDVAEDAASYFEIMRESADGAETLPNVGEDAYLEPTGTDDSPAFSVGVLSKNAVILLNALRVDRETAIALARRAAGNLPAARP